MSKSARTARSPARSPSAIAGARGSLKTKTPEVVSKSPRRSPRGEASFPATLTFRGKRVFFPKVASASGKPLPFYPLMTYAFADTIPFVAFYDKEGQQLAIYKLVLVSPSKGSRYRLAEVFSVDKLFVGKSKGPLAHEGYTGPAHDGNTILFHLKGSKNYILYQVDFKEFTSFSEIKSFTSPIRMDETPHPYALDDDGNLYDFGEGTKTPKVYANSEKDYGDVLNGKRKKNIPLQITTVIHSRVGWKPDSDAIYFKSKNE